ncbi:MAG TPA: hypothetical protein VGM34_01045 [Chlamydiales bacterium]|jgi:hypothetical protein
MASATSISSVPKALDRNYEMIESMGVSTGLEITLARCCFSYLEARFDGIFHFIDYFQNVNTLQIPQGLSLIIGKTSVLSEVSSLEIQPTKVEQKVHFFINRMLALIGKAAECRGAIDASSFSLTKDVFAFRAASDFSVTATKGCVDVFLPHLMQLMTRCLIPTIAFEPDRQLRLLGRTGDVREDQKIQKGYSELWEKRAPIGFAFEWISELKDIHCLSEKITSYYGVTHLEQEALSLSSSTQNGLSFSLERTFEMARNRPLSYPSLVRVTEVFGGAKGFRFSDRNAIVVIEADFGLNQGFLEIEARNLIVLPRVEVWARGGGRITTEGSIVFLGPNESKIQLKAKSGCIVQECGAEAVAVVKTIAPAYAGQVRSS